MQMFNRGDVGHKAILDGMEIPVAMRWLWDQLWAQEIQTVVPDGIRVRVASPTSLTYTEVCPARHGRLAQLVRAPALQAGSRGFESLTAHQRLVL